MKLFFVVLSFLGFFFPVSALAESVIYLRNHTRHTLTLTTQVNALNQGPKLKVNRDWKQLRTSIESGDYLPILKFKRAKVSKGKRYGFETRISHGKTPSVLRFRQEVSGTGSGSTMVFGIDQHPFMVGKSTKPAIKARWKTGLRSYDVTGKATKPIGKNSDVDIVYVIEEDDIWPLPGMPGNQALTVMAYNIWLIPGAPNMGKRVKEIPAVVRGHDVVVFSEAFNNDQRKALIKGLSKEYKYISNVIDKMNTPMNGGIFMASKWPFVGTPKSKVFPHSYKGKATCVAEDCHSAKGVQYRRINKLGKIYHVFGTHLQNPDPVFLNDAAAMGAKHLGSTTARSVLKQQALLIGDFIKKQNISSDEPVIIAGDLNVELGKTKLLNQMLGAMGAALPNHPPGPYHTFLPAKPEDREHLDYVLYSKKHLPPVSAEQITVIPPGWPSDHFPVSATYEFPILDFELRELWLKWSKANQDNFSMVSTPLLKKSFKGYGRRPQAKILATPQAGTQPLKVYWSDKRKEGMTLAHKTSEKSAKRAGYNMVTIIGHVWSKKRPGTVPLKQWYNPKRKDNFLTAGTKDETTAKKHGYRYVRTEGWAYTW